MDQNRPRIDRKGANVANKENVNYDVGYGIHSVRGKVAFLRKTVRCADGRGVGSRSAGGCRRGPSPPSHGPPAIPEKAGDHVVGFRDGDGGAGATRRRQPFRAMTPQPTEADFEAIEAAVSATARGRWFLAEYARRRREENALRILAALDRLETRAVRGEVDRARQRLEAERAAEIVRQLAQVLKDLRPLADARVRARAVEARASERGREPAEAGGLERRFAALVKLDEQDLEDGLKLFG